MKRLLVAACASSGTLLGIACTPSAPRSAPVPTEITSLIPAPQRIQRGSGSWIVPDTVIVTVSDPDNAELRQLAAFAADVFATSLRLPATVAASGPANGIRLRLTQPDGQSDESYSLHVGRDGG